MVISPLWLTTELSYSLITNEKEGPLRVFMKVKEGEKNVFKEGMVDLNGREVVPPKFDSITWMGDNLLLVSDKATGKRFYVDVMGNRFLLNR